MEDETNGVKISKNAEKKVMGDTGLTSGWGLAYNSVDGLLYGTDGGYGVKKFDPINFDARGDFRVVYNGSS